MKKNLLTFLIAGMGLVSQAQNVAIPDANFKSQLLLAGVDVNGDTLIQKSEAEAISKLQISTDSVLNMTGIEAFVNLDTLIASGLNFSMPVGDLTSINLTNNTKLTYLSLSGNKLSMLDLNQNKLLRYIDLWQNNLFILNIGNCTELRTLYCSSNSLSSLSLNTNTKLTTLWAEENKLSGRANFSNLILLRQLGIYSNPNLETVCLPAAFKDSTAFFSGFFPSFQKDSTATWAFNCGITIDSSVYSHSETIKVYNFVSPNGDGKHDFLEIENIEFYGNNSLQIFNRWGQKMFSADGVKNSDKILSDIDWPDGTYYYVLDLGNDSKPDKGYFLLKK